VIHLPALSFESAAVLLTQAHYALPDSAPPRRLAANTPLAPQNNQRYIMVSNSGLRKGDATYIEMEQIVRSAEGRKTAIDAAENMVPALCGVDRLLREKLGDRYRKIDGGTVCAGALVAELMRELGYTAGTRKRCGDDCLARSAILWTKP